MKKLLFITLLILTFLSCKKDLVDNSKSTTNSDLNLMKRAQKDVFKYFLTMLIQIQISSGKNS